MYLLSGADQSANVFTLADSNYVYNPVGASVPIMPSDIVIEIDEGEVQLGSLGTATSDLPVTYVIIGPDAQYFQIDSVTGAISFIQGPDYDNPLGTGGNTYYISRTAFSSAGYADQPQNITINVQNIVDELLPQPFLFPVVWNYPPETSVSRTVSLTGPEPGATLTAVNFELSNDGGQTWGSSTTYVPNLTLVRATIVSSDTPGGYVDLVGSVNGVSSFLRVFTQAVSVGTSLKFISEIIATNLTTNLITELVNNG